MTAQYAILAGKRRHNAARCAQCGAARHPTVDPDNARRCTTIEGVPDDIAQIPLLEHLSQGTMPATADLAFGASNARRHCADTCHGRVRGVTNYVARRSVLLLERPTMWRADLLMSTTVFLLLTLHIGEIFIWSAALIYSGIVSDWRSAGFFAGNTYTTLGYGRFVLSGKWEMLAPIMAISGLFTFGWSGSVLVDLVARCQKIKDAANATPPKR